MRAVVQRVNNASVDVDDKCVGSIKKGILVFLGVGKDDTEADIHYLADKIINLRIFEDDSGKMNLSLRDIDGQMLIISQFTLYGDCRKGKRPSFDKAGAPDDANILYERFISYCSDCGVFTQKGVFGADMKVSLLNDGPVTILLDSKKLF